MARAPLLLLGLVSVSCGGGPVPERSVPSAQVEPESVAGPHALVGNWALIRREGPTGLRLELRVDSVTRGSAFGRLTFFMTGDAAMLAPADWGPLGGAVAGDSIALTVPGGAAAPAIMAVGRLTGDTVRLQSLRIGADTPAGGWLLVRSTDARP